MKYLPKNKGTIVTKKDYSKRIIFTPEDLRSKGNLLQVVSIKPGVEQRLHFHHQQTEVFFILEGRAYIVIENKKMLAKPGDAFICEPKEKHKVINSFDKEFKLVVFKINLPKTNDIFWAEK